MVANFIAVGPMCLHTVGFPKLPKGRHVIHLMGVPDIFKKNTKRRNIKMNWILFPTDGDMQYVITTHMIQLGSVQNSLKICVRGHPRNVRHYDSKYITKNDHYEELNIELTPKCNYVRNLRGNQRYPFFCRICAF